MTTTPPPAHTEPISNDDPIAHLVEAAQLRIASQRIKLSKRKAQGH
jgi:hypothetical protein